MNFQFNRFIFFCNKKNSIINILFFIKIVLKDSFTWALALWIWSTVTKIPRLSEVNIRWYSHLTNNVITLLLWVRNWSLNVSMRLYKVDFYPRRISWIFSWIIFFLDNRIFYIIKRNKLSKSTEYKYNLIF
jgi:hypothetical protein